MKIILTIVVFLSFGLHAKVIMPIDDLSAKEVKQVKNFYKQYLQKFCGFTATNFAKMHTQTEWDTMKSDGKFVNEILTICPKSSTNVAQILTRTHGKENFEYLMKFSVEYAKDTGKIPPC